MTVTNIERDLDSLTLTITAEFAASPEAVWELWADPRKLERWWGPPVYPAKFKAHDLVAGGRMTYYMTGPQGDQHHGWWEILRAEHPNLIEFEDGFADEHGVANRDLPVTSARVTFSPTGAGSTQMTIASRFPSREGMEQVIAMGVEEGMTSAMNQMDALLPNP